MHSNLHVSILLRVIFLWFLLSLSPHANAQGKQWSDWRSLKLYTQIEYRIRNNGYSAPIDRSSWTIEFRNKYQNARKIYWSYTPNDNTGNRLISAVLPNTSDRMNVTTPGKMPLDIHVDAVNMWPLPRDQASANGALEAAKTVQSLAVQGKLSPQDLALLYTYLRTGDMERSWAKVRSTDQVESIKPQKSEMIRGLAELFVALDLYAYAEATGSTLRMQPGDILVYFLNWNKPEDNAVIVFTNFNSDDLSGDALVYIVKDGAIKSRPSFQLSFDPRTSKDRGIRPGLLWLRPLTTVTGSAPETRQAADTYISQGNILLQQKRYAEAENLFARATQIEPNNPLYQRALGFALASQDGKDKQEQAITALSKAIRLKPALATGDGTTLFLAMAFQKVGRVSDGITTFHDLSARDPQNIELHFWLAYLCYQSGDYATAESEFRKCLINNSATLARKWLIASLRAQGKNDAADEQQKELDILNKTP